MAENTVTLSTGVVLELARPSRWLMQEKMRQMMPRKPEVPKVYIEDKEVWEENPNDPAFKEAVETFLTEWNRASEYAQLILGTTIRSVPDGFARPEDDGWIQELKDMFDIDVPTAPKGIRYAEWVKLWACKTEDDNLALAAAVAGLAGTPEAKVAEAADAFRGGEERPADLGALAEKPSGNGNNVRPIRRKSGAGV